MKSDKFPIKSAAEFSIIQEEEKEIKKKTVLSESSTSFITISNTKNEIPNEVQSRYAHSNYLVDSHRFRFKTIVRILAYVIKYVSSSLQKLKERCCSSQPIVSGCKNMKLNFRNIQHKLQLDVNVQFEVCPVGGYNQQSRKKNQGDKVILGQNDDQRATVHHTMGDICCTSSW